MKKLISTLITLMLILPVCTLAQNSGKQVQVDRDMTVIATPEVYGLVKTLANDYSKKHPGNEITVLQPGDENIPEEKFIGTVTSTPEKESQWQVTLCRRLLVPVVSSSHPHLEMMKKNGVTKATLATTLSTGKAFWKTHGQQPADVNILVPADKKSRQDIESYVGGKINASFTKSYYSSQEALKALQQDKDALAFVPLKSIVDEENNALINGLAFLPIDRNANGHLDYMEDIYSDIQAFTRGVWIGKYPRQLCSNIYLVADQKPENSKAISFVNYLLTQGQDQLVDNGYNNLAYTERHAEMQKISSPVEVASPDDEENTSWATIILVIAAIIGGTGAVVYLISGYSASYAPAENQMQAASDEPLSEETIEAPEGLYFDKSHTWSFMEKSGQLRMGIDDFLQKVTGPITRIRFAEIGTKVAKGDAIATIVQNGKQIIIKSPVTGTIDALNHDLEKDAARINRSPYDEGWLYMITPDNWQRETAFLKMADNYRQWLQQEIVRLKDFLAYSLRVEKDKYANVVLQDGGSIKLNVLQELSPEVWEEFQQKFMDAEK